MDLLNDISCALLYAIGSVGDKKLMLDLKQSVEEMRVQVPVPPFKAEFFDEP